jgi:hypothetical protein
MFRIKESDANVIDEGKNIEKKKVLIKTQAEVLQYLEAIQSYVNGFINYLKDAHRDDEKNKHTLEDDVKKCYDELCSLGLIPDNKIGYKQQYDSLFHTIFNDKTELYE